MIPSRFLVTPVRRPDSLAQGRPQVRAGRRVDRAQSQVAVRAEKVSRRRGEVVMRHGLPHHPKPQMRRGRCPLHVGALEGDRRVERAEQGRAPTEQVWDHEHGMSPTGPPSPQPRSPSFLSNDLRPITTAPQSSIAPRRMARSSSVAASHIQSCDIPGTVAERVLATVIRAGDVLVERDGPVADHQCGFRTQSGPDSSERR